MCSGLEPHSDSRHLPLWRDLSRGAEARPWTAVLRCLASLTSSWHQAVSRRPCSSWPPHLLPVAGPVSPAPSPLARALTWLLPFLGPSGGADLREVGFAERAVRTLNTGS